MTVQFDDLFRDDREVAGAKAEATAKATEALAQRGESAAHLDESYVIDGKTIGVRFVW